MARWTLVDESRLSVINALCAKNHTAHLDQVEAVEALIRAEILAARIAENQRYVDLADKFNNRKPKPGELTAASFGSAGAGMVESSYYKSFKARIAELEESK